MHSQVLGRTSRGLGPMDKCSRRRYPHRYGNTSRGSSIQSWGSALEAPNHQPSARRQVWVGHKPDIPADTAESGNTIPLLAIAKTPPRVAEQHRLYELLQGEVEVDPFQRDRMHKWLAATTQQRRTERQKWLKHQRCRSGWMLLRWAQRDGVEGGFTGL